MSRLLLTRDLMIYLGNQFFARVSFQPSAFHHHTSLARQIPVTDLASSSRYPATCSTESSTTGIDRQRLATITLARITKENPLRTLCPYELQGGTCSDTGCKGIHLSSDLVPTSEDPPTEHA
jgi:hypothetical protein